ncbi:MAG: hypothetical protein ABI273_07925 [Lacunisphaera sp.]
MWEALTDFVRSKSGYYRAKTKCLQDETPKPEGPAAWLAGIGAMLAAILAAVAACVIWQQLGTMQQDSTDNAAYFLAGNRAYIIRSEKTSISLPHDSKFIPIQFIFTPQFVNTGKTPAFRVTCSDGIAYSEAELVAAEKPNGGEDYIGPEQLAGCQMLVFPASDLVATFKGQKKLFYWVRVDYRDAFKGTPPRHTAMCGAIKVNFDPEKPVEGGAINANFFTIETGMPHACNFAD